MFATLVVQATLQLSLRVLGFPLLCYLGGDIQSLKAVPI